MDNDLLRWRREASMSDWVYLAEFAKTSPGYLNLIAYGFRRASPDMAGRIEQGTRMFEAIRPVLKEGLVFSALKRTAD